MKKLLFLFLITVQSVVGQNITGIWHGKVVFMGREMPVLEFQISAGQNGELETYFVSPEVSSTKNKLKETSWLNDTLNIKGALSFKGVLNSEDELVGNIKQGSLSLPITLKRGAFVVKRPQTPEPPYSYYTEDVKFKNEVEGNVLAGTIAAPNQNKSTPIFVMITGSGPQNRDSELFQHKPFLVIADHLAKNGIATLRLDDRGVGGSDKGKTDSTSLDFAGDISSAVNFLVAKGYEHIGLIGHSEGGMIAPIVGQMNSNVKSMVLLAGPGIPVSEVMELQVYKGSLANGMPDFQAKIAAVASKKMYDFLNSYSGTDLKTDALDYSRKLNLGMNDQMLKSQVNQMTSSWYLYFIGLDPDKYLSKTTVPVLALNGALDVQITSKENLSGIRKSLEKAGNKNFEIVEFEGLNHLFQTAKTGSNVEYVKIEETFSPLVLTKITEWIKALKK